MARFQYRAIGPTGDTVAGEMEESDQRAVIAKLQKMGQLPVNVREIATSGFRSWLQKDIFSARPSLKELGVMTHELAALLKAGLPLDRALRILIGVAETRRLRAALKRILERVQGGAAFADAIAAEGNKFPRLYASLVRAGEASGALETTLLRLSEFLSRSQAVRETVVSAMIYPAILLVFAAVSIVLVLTVVLPQFEPLFREAGKSLPLSTRIIVAAGQAVHSYWWAMLAATVAFILLCRGALRDPKVVVRWHSALLKMPVLGSLIAKSEAARFSRTLGTLLATGVPVSAALAITRPAIGNAAMARAVETVTARVKEGEGLAAPLAATAVFPELTVQLVRVGEETGQLDAMLVKQADIYERDVQRMLERLLALLVPMLTVTLGLIIGGIIASVFAAIISVNQLAF